MGRGPKRVLQSSHGPPLAVLLVAVVILFLINHTNKNNLQGQIDDLKVGTKKLGGEIVAVKATAASELKVAESSRSIHDNQVGQDLKALGGRIDSTFKAVSQSIDATNVEVELVKSSVAGLGYRVDSGFADVSNSISNVAINLAGTDARVSWVDARASEINGNMERIGAGLEGFYNQVQTATEWSVTGPGGCNDKFEGKLKNGSAWKVTRGFVHSNKKVTSLAQCKLVCRNSEWGCSNIAFYGAGPGWCYGFKTCKNHSTGQGWGGYTTYSRSALKSFDRFAGDL